MNEIPGLLMAHHFPLDSHAKVGDLYKLEVFIDGKFYRGDEARVSVWDHGLLFGDGVFEGIRAYNGGVYKLDEHIRRLFSSAKAISLELTYTPQELRSTVLETLKRNSLLDAHIRIVVTRGMGQPGMNPSTCPQPTLVVMAYPFPPTLGDKPVRLITSTVRRKAPHSVDARVKSLNYLDSILAKLQAIASGMDDAIMLDISGHVAEVTGANIFAVIKGMVSTPSLSACLPGITRETVLDLSLEMGLPVVERSMTPGDFYVAEEAFLTGSGAEVVPVGEIDGRRIGDGTVGSITSRIIEAYRKSVLGQDHVTRIDNEKFS